MTISCLLVLSRQLGSVPAAIRQFEEQDYPERELLILDAHSLAGLVDIPASPRIRLLQLPTGMNREAQLRFAAQNADGELICEWEAGAWQAPGRLAAQKRKTRTATVLDTAPETRMWRREALDALPIPIPGGKLFRTGEIPREGRAPLVSCVMPTRNRRWAVPLALEWFAAQDYPSKELLVIDDGELPVEDLVQGHPNVRYLRPNARLSVGAKRNLGCRQARGEFVAHWDDDDWMAPKRLSYQVGSLLASGADLCGVEQMLYWEPINGQAWRYVYPADQPRWVAGGSFLYRHAAWESQPFDDVNVGEDNRFVWGMAPERVLPLAEFDFYVALLHAGNTSLKLIEPTRWAPADPGAITRLMGKAADRFREAMKGMEDAPRTLRSGYQPPEAPLRPGASKEPPRFPVAEVPSFTLARAEHVELPEFAALRNAVALPYMRQWELPFALFQARLEEEMTVLDCTINPTCLGEAIEQLYPRVIYHHWQPLPNGRLSVPQGQAFDRVFCINTLEHLLAAEREQLMAAMAALLKPGGILICTVDQYFDSAWKDPAWLGTGLLRADGAEVPNGFNRVDPEGLAGLAARHGLRADGVPPGKARERDESLYLNPSPFRHGSLGAVFRKGRAAKFAGARKVVLALLSWNTREITLEALSALETEARMLRRMGHAAAICVVDNGSTDGASEALKKRKIGVPHRVIRNRSNLGNSTARNQMIDYALAEGADYLFFCDGDIEPVPFSTFVMLRYMESSGPRLGCFGAYSFQCTPDRQRTTPFLFSLAGCPMESSDVLAWTQYGMFRCRMFRDGVRFEENGPFGEPGHGLEDVDLAFQMNALGYANQYFGGMWYLHRNLSSSVGILREQGVNPTAAYYARRDYMVSKWENNPAAAQSLGWLRNARPPWPGESRSVLRYKPGAPELAAPPAAIAMAEAAASDMLDRVELEAIGWLLGSFDWKASPSAIVVEIGAYVGRTTVFMARLLGLFGVAPKIVSIDPFERCTPDNYNPQGSYSRYMAHLRENGVDRQCMALVAYSEDAAVAVPASIGVLVIDGWHYYDTVRLDLALYLPKVVAGGFVFIDDYGPAYPDVVRAVDEFLAADSEFEVLAKEYYVVLRRR